MRVNVEYKQYDRMIYLFDFRYATTVVGLIKYFNHFEIKYEISNHPDYGPCLYYCDADIKKDLYLNFVETYFEDLMYHRQVEKMLVTDNNDKTFVSSVNKLLNAYKYSENLFKNLGVKYDGTNKDEILDIIAKYRYSLIEKRFAKSPRMYYRYASDNRLFSDDQPCCRLHGYWVDQDKKTKSLGYCFDENSCVSHDIKEFDFIPFAFENGFFINNNCEINALLSANNSLKECIKSGTNEYSAIFKQIREASKYAISDVEIIYVKSNKDVKRYETFFIRNNSAYIINKIRQNCVDVAKMVFSEIMNVESLDNKIEHCLKMKRKTETVEKLIDINICIEAVRKESNMNDTTVLDKDIDNKRYRAQQARKCAYKILKQMECEGKLNKINSYRTKLTSALIYNDADRVCQILLQMSTYTNTSLFFAYDLFEDFENNKYIVHSFIAALDKNNLITNKGEKNE